MIREGLNIGLYYGLSASLILFGLAWLASVFIRSSTVCGLAAFVGWLAILTIMRRFSFAYHHGPVNAVNMVTSSAVGQHRDRRFGPGRGRRSRSARRDRLKCDDRA